jgi:hypothetical protein
VRTVVKGGRSKGLQSKFSYAQMMRDVLVASMNKGQFPLAIVALIFIVIIVKMPAEDVSKLMFHVVERLEQGQMIGYVLAVFFAMGWFFHARFQRRLINDEMQRISQQRTSLQARTLGKRIKSSEGRS